MLGNLVSKIEKIETGDDDMIDLSGYSYVGNINGSGSVGSRLQITADKEYILFGTSANDNPVSFGLTNFAVLLVPSVVSVYKFSGITVNLTPTTNVYGYIYSKPL